jgi:hypothetical protein
MEGILSIPAVAELLRAVPALALKVCEKVSEKPVHKKYRCIIVTLPHIIIIINICIV